MMELVKRENYDDIPCDFYRNDDNEFYLTREQIGKALGYTNPGKAITLIHQRHRDRLDQFSIRMKQETAQNGDSHELPQSDTLVKTAQNEDSHERGQSDTGRGDTKNMRPQNKNLQSEVVYYSVRGVMEICRWSEMENADKFMDWCYDIIMAYRRGELISRKEFDVLLAQVNQLQAAIESNTNSIDDLGVRMTRLDSGTVLPKDWKYQWMRKTYKKVDELAQLYREGSKRILSRIRNKMDYYLDGRTFMDFQDDFYTRYPDQKGNKNVHLLDIVVEYDDTRYAYERVYQDLWDDIQLSNSEREFFDGYAAWEEQEAHV